MDYYGAYTGFVHSVYNYWNSKFTLEKVDDSSSHTVNNVRRTLSARGS